jgi:hypothetical protein
MITSFNFYYAQPGQEDAVLRQRLRACDVRENIGVPRGRVLARSAGAADLPDVIWEHQFDDVDGHHTDMAARAASTEFEAIRAGMRKLCRRFERPLFEICGAAKSDENAPDSRIVTLDWIFCASSAAPAALALLEQHANACSREGLQRSRILRLITPGSDLPALMWQHEYAQIADYERMQARLASCDVIALTQKVERSVWKVE